MKPQKLFFLILGLLVFIFSVAWYLYPKQKQEPLPHYAASIQQDCAPWDGGAFLLKIPLENGNFIDVAIWESPALQSEKTFFFEEPSQVGTASLVHSSASAEQLVGKVFFTRVNLDSPVEGTFELETIDSGQHFEGQFHATWLDRIRLCG